MHTRHPARNLSSPVHDCLEDKMDITQVNRLLYAGAWVVTEELGMIGGKVGDGNRKEKKNHIGSKG